MADDLDELRRRLDRIEQLLRRPADGGSRVPAGPEVRSARSIVSRVDDVWVAVTEGNERIVAAIERLRGDVAARAGDAAAQDAGGGNDPAPGTDTVPAVLPGTEEQGGEASPMARVEDALVPPAEADPAVYLRLNRIEEALAGIAARLSDLPTASPSPPPPAGDGEATVTAVVDSLGSEVRRLGQQVDGLVHALEASVSRSIDDTLAQRIGRLRDQFRR